MNFQNISSKSVTSELARIHNSVDLRNLFQQYAQEFLSTDGALRSTISNLRAASHRFESYAKPLGRSVLHISSLIKVACYLQEMRTDEPARRAKAWLAWLNNDRCVLAAMVADASDQSLQLLRLLDNEDVDPALLVSELHHFISAAVTELFDRR